jgi:hypothetical protein
MRFLALVRGSENAGAPPKALEDAMLDLIKEGAAAGVLVETGGLANTAKGKLFRSTKGKLKVMDGPFTEAKEVIGGYAILQVASKQEAIDWTTRFMQLHTDLWPAYECETELREMHMAPLG